MKSYKILREFNPLTLYFIWLFLLVTYFILMSYIDGGGGGFLDYFVSTFNVGIIGFFALSILSSLNKVWIKKYWILNLVIFLITGFLIIANFFVKY